MKKFILSDVMPSLIRKKVWNSAPKVWDGVSHGVKIFSEHKSAEPTLRCLLGLPGLQFKSILKVAPKVKPLLASLLKALSAEEKEECVSGRFAGLISDISDPVVEAVVDAEKNKILKELSLLG
jgi:Symplekin tight junction protein C terminal